MASIPKITFRGIAIFGLFSEADQEVARAENSEKCDEL
jgi:hypothetical protein